MRNALLALLAPCLGAAPSLAEGLAGRFVRIDQALPDVFVDLRYHGSDNFLGRPVEGYEKPWCWITRKAAEALGGAQEDLRRFGLSLKVFDAYRPQPAVDDFLRWIGEPETGATREAYYPSLTKQQLIDDQYIAPRSGHSRGSSVDLTIVRLREDGSMGPELDMGTPFDFFDPASHSENPALDGRQRANRLLLRVLMEKHGFVHYPEEWWHFTLADEPFPRTWFYFTTAGPPEGR